MKGLGMRNRLRALAATALPSLRVAGMAYTGLIGVVAVVLVVSVGFLPVTPVLQEATQPALEAVVSMVQPATNVVSSLIGNQSMAREPMFQFAPLPQVALASELTAADALAEDAAAVNISDQAAALDEPPVPSTPVFVARPTVLRAAPEAAVEDVPVEDVPVEDVPVEEPEQAVDATDRAPVRQVADVVAEAPVQQAANVEAPRPLPALPKPTETALQARARLDVENQAAIDAAKAAVVRRKADDDAANQTAIDAHKAATVAFVATPLPTLAPEPVKPTATPQTRASAKVDNQALIDAAKAAKAHARSDANAANQAAIDAAKAPHAVKATLQPALRRRPLDPRRPRQRRPRPHRPLQPPMRRTLLVA